VEAQTVMMQTEEATTPAEVGIEMVVPEVLTTADLIG
jgi:hypothetical protein